MEKTTRIYFDTEFIEDGKTIDLISIGMVKDNGDSYYAVSEEFDWQKANDFVVKNVFPSLGNVSAKSRKVIKKEIIEFCNHDDLEFWAYYCSYDWVVLCQLFGTMMDLPKNFPMYCNDLKSFSYLNGIENQPAQEDNHNALDDAKWNKEYYDLLMGNG